MSFNDPLNALIAREIRNGWDVPAQMGGGLIVHLMGRLIGRLTGYIIIFLIGNLLLGGPFGTVHSVSANPTPVGTTPVGTLTIQLQTIPSDVALVIVEVESAPGGKVLATLQFDVTSEIEILHDLRGVEIGVWNVTATAANDAGETLYGARQSARVRANRPATADMREWLPRHDSEHGIFYGYDLGRPTLIDYATFFETTIVPQFADSTGLKPGGQRAIFNIYGSKEAWALITCGVPDRMNVSGCYLPLLGQIFMAHWRTPDILPDGVLLGHEYMHWLANEVGNILLPRWFNEGLADAEAWRVWLGADTWDNPRTEERWQQITEAPDPIPNLALHQRLDAFVATAMAYLLENHGGRNALRTFFARTQEGVMFSDAFQNAFGLTVPEFQTAYEKHAIGRRGQHAQP